MFIVFVGVFCWQCNTPSNNRPMPPAEVIDTLKPVNILRFEKDLIQSDTLTATSLAMLRNKYGEFLPLFCKRICPIPMNMANDTILALQLNRFKFDNDIKTIYASVDSVYPNLNVIAAELAQVFALQKLYLQISKPPAVITFLSAFNYAMITTDTMLLIGLDKYLGSDCPFYPGMNYPAFITKRLRSEYILPNAINAMYQRDYSLDSVKDELLAQVVYYGKMMQYTAHLLPQLADSIILGYSKAELDWCLQNETKIWTALIEQQLLYSTNPKQFLKLINDGPTTQGFPDGAPARLGYFVGWQIVKAYINKTQPDSMQKWLNESDAQKILLQSQYKPN
ncbi:MAG TPA: hypothetical protein PLO59_10180, partial [Bacteroidia bacterium]|nr:hypothetical protein [Bacteroidia bacterium]